MNRFFSIFWLALAAFLLVGAAEPKPRLTFEGLGPIRIGMTAGQLENLAFKGQPKGDWQTREEYIGCRYITNDKDYPGIDLMLNEEKLVRIDVSKGDWRTLSGAMLGMSKAEVKAIYGNWLKQSLHPYGGSDIDEWSYQTLASSSGKYAAIFEISERKTSQFRLGLKRAVGYIEGCS